MLIKFLLLHDFTRPFFINVCLPIVRVAAWYYENVISPGRTMVFDPVYVPFRRWFGPHVGLRVANAVEDVVGALLLDFPVWQIAGGYLQAKWHLELEAENRLYRERLSDGN